ncbi:hypothetical protein BC829DRAFT_420518 [Chytridium lagenaria]|nr:hypothetical protein BC829DRAFT_420518 [Chytridium lagenaria]
MSSSPSTFGPPPNQYSIPLPLIIFLAIFGVIFVCAFVFTVYRIVAIRQGLLTLRILHPNRYHLRRSTHTTPAYLTSDVIIRIPSSGCTRKDTKPEKQTTTTMSSIFGSWSWRINDWRWRFNLRRCERLMAVPQLRHKTTGSTNSMSLSVSD